MCRISSVLVHYDVPFDVALDVRVAGSLLLHVRSR